MWEGACNVAVGACPENDPQLGTDDPIEEDPPGKVLLLNTDDDNANDLPDLQEGGPFVDADGNPVADDDLVPARLSWDSLGLDLTGYRLQLSADPALKLWTTQDKQALVPESFLIGTDPVPETIYLEGVEEGEAWVSWTLLQPGGQPVAEDQVRVTVANFDIRAYRPLTEGPDYGNPFQKTEVPPKFEQNPGVGIRRNGDDDNKNGTPDNDIQDVAVQNENDLIEINLVLDDNQNLDFYLKRSQDGSLRVWRQRDKRAVLLDDQNVHETRIPYQNNGLVTLWVEWVNMDWNVRRSELILEARDKRNGNVIQSQKLVFYPFTSIVIAFGGSGQQPSDPPDQNHGTFTTAKRLYSLGYDVYMYKSDNEGAALAEIKSAIKHRQVGYVGIFGYSSGGGATYDLAEMMSEEQEINQNVLRFTSYVDAYNDWERRLQETRRPLGTAFHLTQYQLNKFPTGAPTRDAQQHDLNIDRSNLKTPLNDPVDHYTIDDHEVVIRTIINELTNRLPR